MSGQLAGVTLGPKEWTSLILVLERKCEELQSYNGTSYCLRKVTSEKPKDASWNLEFQKTSVNEFFSVSFPMIPNNMWSYRINWDCSIFAITLSLHVVVDNYLNWAEEHYFELHNRAIWVNEVGNWRKRTYICEIIEKLCSIHLLTLPYYEANTNQT